MAEHDLAAIVAAVLSALSAETAPAAPASAPAAPTAASPFAAAGLSAARSDGLDSHPAEIAAAYRAGKATGEGRTFARQAARLHRTAGYSCTVDTVLTDADGNAVTVAAHGFAYRKATGAACTGTLGLPAGQACAGTIR